MDGAAGEVSVAGFGADDLVREMSRDSKGSKASGLLFWV